MSAVIAIHRGVVVCAYMLYIISLW